MKQHPVKKIISLMVLSALIFSLSSCSKLTQREYVYTKEHTQGYIAQEDGDALIVESAAGLKEALLYYINEMAPSGTIHLKNYSGDVESDIASVFLDVIRNEPIGSFCVDYIKHELKRIVSYYELTLSFTYTRTPEELANLVSVYSLASAKAALIGAYNERRDKLLLHCFFYDNWADELTSYMNAMYYELPGSALLPPEMTVQLYPSSGMQRIMEISLSYESPPNVELLQMKQLRDRAGYLVEVLDLHQETVDADETAASLLSLYNWLAENVSYDYASEESAESEPFSKNISFTAYGALNSGKATSEGFALTFKLICDMLGIDCLVVEGHRSGRACCWNIVTVGDKTYHVDPSYFSFSDEGSGFLRSDESFSDTYRWNLSKYPICSEDWIPPESSPESSAEQGEAAPATAGDTLPEETPGAP